MDCMDSAEIVESMVADGLEVIVAKDGTRTRLVIAGGGNTHGGE